MGVNQSVYSGICILVSTLSESSDQLSKLVQKVAYTLPLNDTLSIYCHRIDAFVCFRFRRYNAGDWKFCYTHFNLSVGVSGHFSIVEICCWSRGDAYGLHYKDCYDCLMATYWDPWIVPNYNECKRGTFEGWCLSSTELIAEWGRETDNLIHALRVEEIGNGLADKWRDCKYVREKRVDLAQNKSVGGHGILTYMQPEIG